MSGRKPRKRPRQNPETLALRYRAWREARSIDFEITKADLAEALDVPLDELSRALRGQQWARQLITPRRADLDDTEAARSYLKGSLK